MSEVRGWAHEDMMKMSKTVFFRYYGYWYSEQLEEEARYKYEQKKNKTNSNRERNWKTL